MSSPDDDDQTAPPTYAPSISGLQLLPSAVNDVAIPTCPSSPIFVFSQDGELRAIYPTSSTAGPYAQDLPPLPMPFPSIMPFFDFLCAHLVSAS
ncbi:hypothetical protein SCLCIDRAFT_24155 [Scleroderma citrinum Foug A]|uniref:Uncharacterized protein n=1 Tax=Scleroderma citrinum Foug A TaxID=1036808 RepID=A0A0C3E4U6_9AGAM|nr:hypothetical protein SCLCIDRAFT_24155 [Scleroderma citrinum Foug A]